MNRDAIDCGPRGGVQGGPYVSVGSGSQGPALECADTLSTERMDQCARDDVNAVRKENARLHFLADEALRLLRAASFGRLGDSRQTFP